MYVKGINLRVNCIDGVGSHVWIVSPIVGRLLVPWHHLGTHSPKLVIWSSPSFASLARLFCFFMVFVLF